MLISGPIGLKRGDLAWPLLIRWISTLGGLALSFSGLSPIRCHGHSCPQVYWNGHVWQTSLEQDRVGVVGHGPDHIQVTWRRGCQVTTQVTKNNQGVAKQTEGISDQVEDALVLLSLLCL